MGGRPFYAHVYHALLQAGLNEIVISSNKRLADKFGQYEVIVDDMSYQQCGPLAGLYTVMDCKPSDSYLVISVDTPFITSEAIRYLIANYTGNITVYKDEQIHAAIAIYPYMKDEIQQLLDEQRLALRNLFDEQTVYIDVDAVPGNWHANINTPHDLREGE